MAGRKKVTFLNRAIYDTAVVMVVTEAAGNECHFSYIGCSTLRGEEEEISRWYRESESSLI